MLIKRMTMAYVDGRHDITVSHPVLLIRIFHCRVHAVTCNGHIYRDQQQIISTFYIVTFWPGPTIFLKLIYIVKIQNISHTKRVRRGKQEVATPTCWTGNADRPAINSRFNIVLEILQVITETLSTNQ